MKEKKIGTYIRGEENYTFEFYTDLTTTQKLKFINSVVDLLVDGNNYNYIIKDLLFDFFLIDVMTEIDLDDYKKSSRFVYDIEKFLEETNIIDIIKANAEFGLIEELEKAIDLNVQYKTGIHPNPLNDALSSLLSTIERKIDAYNMDEAMEMVSKFSGMTEDFTPENIVKAYLKTDIHKKNLDKIAETKNSKEESIDIVKDNVIDFENNK